MITVLMYHAIPRTGDSSVGADPHYSVAAPEFERQLGLMRDLGLRPMSVRALLQPGAARGVGITFDDGHVTNYQAAEMLHRMEGSADFFINPSTVGSEGFLSWDQLRQMAAWGMSIQSHGMHHRFLDDLALKDVEAELAESKSAIERELGGAVTLFAPPGGRQAPGMDALARRLGYERICSSRVGLWQGARVATDVPRMAMLASTGRAQLLRWLRQSPLEMGWQLARYQGLRTAKRMLGNGAYVKLRQVFTGPAGG